MSELRIAVCGVRFGEAYVRALEAGVPGVRLAGIIARGSGRAQRMADRLGIPLWRDATAAIPHVDAAAVVVRTGALGGAGSRLAGAFLDAGRSVLLEHPVHPHELRGLQQKARTRRAALHVNTVYPALPPVRAFIDAVRAWRSARPLDDRHPAFVEVTTSRQLLYSALDIIDQAIGGIASMEIEAPSPSSVSGAMSFRPFADLPGILAGLPLYLRLQTYLERDDHDQHSLAMHRIALGGPEGSITLMNSFGPVVRTRPLFLPNYAMGDASLLDGVEDEGLAAPTASVEWADAPSLQDAVAHSLPQAIGEAIAAFARTVRDGVVPSAQQPERIEAVARAWLLANQRAGMPDLRRLAPPLPPGTIGLGGRARRP